MVQIATERLEVERSSISWGAIFAGGFISLLVYLTLTALGIAIGGSSLSGVIQEGSGGQALSIGSAIWMAISALVSLFIGSYFAARVSGMITMRIGRVQGMVISALFFGFLLTSIGSVISALGQGAGATLGAAGSAAGSMADNQQVQDTVNRAMGGLNLKSPPGEVAKGVATRLLRGDDTSAKAYLANQAGISRAEADRRIASFKNDFQATAKDVGGKAARAVSIGGWTLFVALVLGTLFAILGGGIGAGASLRTPISRSDRENLSRAA